MSGKRRETPFERRLAKSRENPEIEKIYNEMYMQLTKAMKTLTKRKKKMTSTNIRLNSNELDLLLGFLHSVVACSDDEVVEWTDEDKAAAETLYTRLNAGTMAS